SKPSGATRPTASPRSKASCTSGRRVSQTRRSTATGSTCERVHPHPTNSERSVWPGPPRSFRERGWWGVMRDVAVVSFAQSASVRAEDTRNEVEILMPVVHEAIERSGIGRKEIGFTMSGSCDYLAGAPFAFVSGLDAVGAWPPIRESHVEMDGAWALYEAWVRLQHGDIDTALVYAFGKSSTGDLERILALQLEPYCTQPLWPTPADLAGLQATLVDEELIAAPAGDGAAAVVLKVGGDGPVIRGIDHRIEAHALGVRDL